MNNSEKIDSAWILNKQIFSLGVIYLNENNNSTKYSLSGEKSIFNTEYVNKENKEDILSLFKFADKNHDDNLTYKEIADAVYEIIENSRIGRQLDTNRLKQFFKSKNITVKNIMSILDFINIGNETNDSSTSVQSGEFIFKDNICQMKAEKYSDSEKNRTYILTDLSDGQSYVAMFGGQNPRTQQMVSEFYAKIFDNNQLLTIPITSKQEGEIKGAVCPGINPSTLDKNKKLGLDIFFSNDEKYDYISYAGTLDETSRGLNTIFTIIPTEFNILLTDNDFSAEDIIQALETIVSISDNDIIEILAKYNNTERYKDILLKRKDFIAKMLKYMKSTPIEKSQTINDYIANIQMNVIDKTISSITNEADLNSYLKAVEYIKDENLHNKLLASIQTQRKHLQSNNFLQPLSQYTQEQFDALFKEFSYDQIKKQVNVLLKTENADNVYTRMMPIKQSYSKTCLEIFNNVRQAGIDVTSDIESFAKFILFASITCNAENIDIVNCYNYITDNITKLMPNDNEKYCIDFYKSNSYNHIHKGTDDLITKDVEPIGDIKNIIETLNNFLHKNKTEQRLITYRGERANIFNNIQTEKGKNLGEQLNNLSKKLESIELFEDTPADIMSEIKEVLNFINNNNFEVTNTRFCSMTISRNLADSFHEVTLKIHIPTGSSACFIDLFSPKYVSELEILAPYGAVEKIIGASYDEDNKRIILETILITDNDNN